MKHGKPGQEKSEASYESPHRSCTRLARLRRHDPHRFQWRRHHRLTSRHSSLPLTGLAARTTSLCCWPGVLRGIHPPDISAGIS